MQAVFYGVGAAAIGITTKSAFKLAKSTLKSDASHWSIAVILAISTAVTRRETIWLFLAGGIVSLVIKAIPAKKTEARVGLLPLLITTPFTGSKTFTVFSFFAKAGLFVFGSGLAIVPFLHGGVVLDHHWLTEKQFIDAVAVAMITPGPVVITVAFIGYLVAGTSGAIAAALGVFFPVYLVVVCLAPFYRKHSANPQLRAFVQGVTAAAVGAIAGAVVVLARGAIRDVFTLMLATATLLLLLKSKVPEPVVIIASALMGVVLKSAS